MYDTYEGVPNLMTLKLIRGKIIKKTWWEEQKQLDGQTSTWCNASLTTVKTNLEKVNYQKVMYIL